MVNHDDVYPLDHIPAAKYRQNVIDDGHHRRADHVRQISILMVPETL